MFELWRCVELPDTGELIANGELLKKSEIKKRVEKVTLSAVHSQSQCSYVSIVRMRLDSRRTPPQSDV